MHTHHLRSFALGLSIALTAGCGATVAVDPGDGDESTDPPPVHPTPQTTPVSCGFDAPAGPVLAVAEEGDVTFVRGDGSRQSVLSIPGMPSSTYWQVRARAGVVAVTASGWTDQGAQVGAAALIDREGEVLWSDLDVDGGATTPFISASGDFVFAAGWSRAIRVSRNGVAQAFEAAAPIGAPGADGTFPISVTSTVYALEYGLASAAGGVVSVGIEASSNGAIGFDGGLIYLSRDAGMSILHRETADGVRDVPVPMIPWDVGVYLKGGSPGGDGVMGSWTETGDGAWVMQDWVIRADGGAPEPVLLPDGMFPFGAGSYSGSAMDDDGRVYEVARTDVAGGVFMLDAGHWRRVGPSYANVWDFQVTTRGGTVVAQASDEPGYFEMREWKPTPAGAAGPERTGASGFVARLDGTQVFDFPLAATGTVLSANGGCVAYAEAAGVSALSVDTGRVTPLGVFGDATSAPTMAWIE